MPRKLPVPEPEAPHRKTDWTVYIYYLDYDADLHEIVQVREKQVGDEVQAKYAAGEVVIQGLVLEPSKPETGDYFRFIPPHRIQLVLARDNRG